MSHCDVIDWEIKDSAHPHLICALDPGEKVIAEAGAMVWVDESIVLETKMGDGRNRKKGLPFSGIFQAVGRKLVDEGAFITHFRNDGPMTERVAFTPPVTSSVIPIDMSEFGGRQLICQKGAFLAAAFGTKISWQMADSILGGSVCR